MTPLQFSLLGPLEADSGGQPVPLGPPQRRAVLAALLLDAGRAVTVATLRDRIWSGSPPATASAAIQVHVHHVRHLLRRFTDGATGLPRLVTHPGQPADQVSYLLETDPDSIDVSRFRRLVHEAGMAAARGEQAEAVGLFDTALSLWRGEPLTGLPASEFTESVKQGLEEERAQARRRRAAAMAAVGQASGTREPVTVRAPRETGPAAVEPDAAPETEARVLGPVGLTVDGTDITPSAVRERSLLASLLLRYGQGVPLPTLIQEVWADDPPPNASAQLHNYVHVLRRRIDEAAGPGAGRELLGRSSTGYVLRMNAGNVDLGRFAALLGDARSRMAEGEYDRAGALLRSALSLWKGPALAGVPTTGEMAAWARELEGRRSEASARSEAVRRVLDGADPDVVAPVPAPPLEPRPRASVPRTGGPPSADDGSGALRFAVLGPVRAWRGGETLPTGSPQQRALLAALLLRRGRTATASELVDALWGEDEPDAALAALRTYASRLRKSFAGGAGTLLVSESGGYAIRIGDGVLDLHLAEDYAQQAVRAHDSGDLSSARGLYNQALALWEGEPLAGVPGPYAETQRSRLEEWRLQLLESRIELDLELGRHTEVVSELTALTAAHPLRERLRAQLMLALYRSGRQAEALAVYADTRRLLADELGVDPNYELMELQQRILRADTGLAAPTGGTDGEGAQVFVRPAQLPATIADFTGRAAFVEELAARLASSEGRIMAVSSVAGIGGVGKTTLAVHVAHTARESFPDGQLYVDLQGAGPRPAEPDTVLAAFLCALGAPETSIPDSLEDRAGLYRSLLDGRRVLVLLDNARDIEQIRPLLPGTPGCAALITSRTRMVNLAGAHLVDLDVMSPEEGLRLFAGIVGGERVEAEPDASSDVVAACGYLPLAIRIAASRLAARRTWTVSVLAAKLADERRRLDELQAGDLAVRATFELGYGQLEPAQARAFRLLGLADGPDISLAAAAAVLGLGPYDTEDLLESLVDTSLLESAAPGRYRFHDLIRLYARACAERDELPSSERTAAMSRLLDFYLSSAVAVHELGSPEARAAEPAFTSRAEGLDWLFSEAGNIFAACSQSAAEGRVGRAADMLWAVRDLQESDAWFRAYESTARALLAAVGREGTRLAEARLRALLAQSHLLAGRFTEADREAERAYALGTASADPLVPGQAMNIRGAAAIHWGTYDLAETRFRTALDTFVADGDRHGEAAVLGELSRVHRMTGRTTSAVELAERSLALYRELGATAGLGHGLHALGMSLTAARRSGEAVSLLAEALVVFRENRQSFREGMTLYRTAEIFLGQERFGEAAAHAERALTVLGGLGGDRRRGLIHVVLGKALHGLGQEDRARATWRRALALFEGSGSPEADEAVTLLHGEPAAPSAPASRIA